MKIEDLKPADYMKVNKIEGLIYDKIDTISLEEYNEYREEVKEYENVLDDIMQDLTMIKDQRIANFQSKMLSIIHAEKRIENR